MLSGPSFAFVGFGILVALLVAAGRSLVWRQSVMLVASVVFLATFSRNPLDFAPLGGFLLVGYVALRLTERHPTRVFPFAVGGVILLFVWLKRYAFVPSGLWIPAAYVTVGMSYILFRLLHLIIEARNDPSYARLPVRVYLGYLIGFNTLVAGPIQYYDEYVADQNPETPRVTLDDIGEAAERIVVGLFKTNVLAAIFASTRATALTTLAGQGTTVQDLASGAAVFALYPFFLYCNFSGYIDIVIGLSRLMGQRLPENFDRPLSATSFIDFWNRWHITLSRWLRTYVYNPLLITLLRRFPSRRLETLWATLAFFVTFFLVGVWHGQTTAFLFFGVLQGFGVSVNKLYQIMMTKRLGRKRYAAVASTLAYRTFARGLTFTWFIFTLSWFWGSWSQVATVWSSMGVKRWTAVWVGIFVASSIGLAAWEALRARVAAMEWSGSRLLEPLRVRTAWMTTLLVVVVLVVLISTSTAPEIVYKDF
jgi:D-alanyl-lipoteichoic acid acyltransferase DltB (MBOAT superfamily)